MCRFLTSYSFKLESFPTHTTRILSLKHVHQYYGARTDADVFRLLVSSRKQKERRKKQSKKKRKEEHLAHWVRAAATRHGLVVEARRQGLNVKIAPRFQSFTRIPRIDVSLLENLVTALSVCTFALCVRLSSLASHRIVSCVGSQYALTFVGFGLP